MKQNDFMHSRFNQAKPAVTGTARERQGFPGEAPHRGLPQCSFTLTQWTRRQWLFASAACTLGLVTRPVWAAASATRLAAAWQTPSGYQIGLLEENGRNLRVLSARDIPTRAHGLWLEAGGALLAVARRPGDWLLRWQPSSKATTWLWTEADRAFNGHVTASADGRFLYTSETNLETGGGLVGVREAVTLQKVAEWPTHGLDPHALLLDIDGSLLVANGGIPTLAESGRSKYVAKMASSLVRLHGQSGEQLGLWRLEDQRLSLRHLAWGQGAQGRLLGIALQAEHDDLTQKQQAPVLALFDGLTLRTAPTTRLLAGYGGDIAFASGQFAVSCPRASGIALFLPSGQATRFIATPEACALASDPAAANLWIGGQPEAHAIIDDISNTKGLPAGLRLDNHWLSI